MKTRKSTVFAIFIAIFAVFCLFIACDDPVKPDSTPKYTVSFVANGGSPAPQNQTISRGGKITEPAAMTKTGYDFGGWYTEAAYVYQWNFSNYTVTSNITLYAKWIGKIENFTVTFNANGGSPAPEPQNIAYGDKIIEPAYMTRTDYGFGGWYTEADCINLWNFATGTVTYDMTLYAKWDSDYYTVSFEADGGSPAPEQQNITSGGKVVQPPAMSKTGCTFGGWYTEEDCINQWDFNSDTVTRNITLYAKWDYYTSGYYTVSFEADGGSPAPNPQNIANGGKAVMPPAMGKTGYSFEGWYKEEDCINLWSFNTDTVTRNITLYAKWDYYTGSYYTVSFVANGGSPAPNPQNIANGGKLSKPQDMSKDGYNFESWYKEEEYLNLWDFDHDTVTDDMTLYAKWLLPTVTVSGSTLAEKLQWVAANAVSNGSYLLEVSSVEYLNPQTLSFSGKSNISIQLIGAGGVRNIELYGGGSLFTIGDNVTLILNENIVLVGSGSNSASLVNVYGGKLILNDGSKITGNTSSYGGGVYVGSGTFIMNGGEISGNTSSSGGGVYVGSGTFTMHGGEISGSYGGGVYVDSGTFTMNGGEISGNTSYSSSGGGVYVGSGTFTMNGGEISGNTSDSHGGGVYVGETFTMTGGEISGNTSSSSSNSHGGGVYVGETFTMTGGEISGNTSSSFSYFAAGGGVYVGETFTMTGGEISGNTSSSSSYSYFVGGGGGVYVDGAFIMTGGEISGNTSSVKTGSNTYSFSSGGGVYVSSFSLKFEKTGGIITGYTSDPVNGNVVKNSYGNVVSDKGHAVYINHSDSRFIRYKNTTSGPGDNLIYISNEPAPPTISGEWD